MAGVEQSSWDQASETRTPEKTRQEIVRLPDTSGAVVRTTFQPGWRWSECIKPLVGSDSCQVAHHGTIVSGRLGVAHEDGTTVELAPGDVYLIRPGHDGWVVGDEAVVTVEFLPGA